MISALTRPRSDTSTPAWRAHARISAPIGPDGLRAVAPPWRQPDRLQE